MTSNVLSLLQQALGNSVDTSDEALFEARADKSGKVSDSAPLAVVSPTSVEQVQTTMKIAYEHSIPVVPRGGGSGLAGGAIGQEGEIVLSLLRLNRILEVSVEDRFARVEAGVINHELNEEAKNHGLWFTPDPASRIWSTVGGNIATNAGGLLCAKYGVTRESVLELDVVLADGRLMRMGHRSVKGVTGLDLCNLMIGSEGTLGVIVEATVKLEPLSKHSLWTLRADFSSLHKATEACQEIIKAGITPAIMELMDHVAYRHIARFVGETLPDNETSVVIVQTDGADAEAQARDISSIFESLGGAVTVLPDGQGAEQLLATRRAMHPAMESSGTVLIEDVSVPRSKLHSMFDVIRRIESQFDVSIPTVAHAADGNLHPNFIYSGESVPAHVWDAADALFREAVAMGGTLTGEHGVGLLKRRWLEEELGAEQWKLQREIKRVFDPTNILNPGKVFA